MIGQRVAFQCPICSATLLAEIDPAGEFPVVSDLEGCLHADAFGAIGRLTLYEESQVISCALEAFALKNVRDEEGHALCPICEMSITHEPTIQAGRIAYHSECWRPFERSLGPRRF
jgi:hypothetical protein